MDAVREERDGERFRSSGKDRANWVFDVRDETSAIVFSIKHSDAIRQ